MSASSLDLKSTRLDALLLPLASRDWEAALHSMRTQWAAVAGAFDGELLVLDLRGLPPQGAPVPWLRIKQTLAELGLNAVGVLGLGQLAEAEQQGAQAAGLPARDEAGAARTSTALPGALPAAVPAAVSAASPMPQEPPPSAAPATAAPLPRGPRCMVIDRPLRSGQQVYARDADLVVLGLVSHGAEVIADGSVHVYGALRGRAIAGAKGDLDARVYAQSLEAELLAVAGVFRTSEKPLPPEVAGKPAQVRLEGERLVFEPLKY